jgi:hypothetical protein
VIISNLVDVIPKNGEWAERLPTNPGKVRVKQFGKFPGHIETATKEISAGVVVPVLHDSSVFRRG